MTCENIKNQILLKEPAALSPEVLAHIKRCSSCQEFQQTLSQSQHLFQPTDQPSEALLNKIKHEARRQVPSHSLHIWRRLRPLLATAASVTILLGIVLTRHPQQKINPAIPFAEIELLDAQDQVASAVNESFSEDELAFNFVMTYDDTL